MGLAIAGNNNGSDNATVYANAFAVQPSHLPYRAPQTVKPLIDGPQIATVVGPEGEEIHTDQYGRVKVHFPWDRHKDPRAEDSSCWIRVSSNWAGAKWAHIAIPRIGQEVIVDFLEGDPDQPIVTGRTYNEKNMPPYNLPEHKTRMTIQSKTHKGDGFNELRFEDEKDQEEVFIHAQKDMNVIVLHDRNRDIGNDQTEKIGHDKTIDVANIHKESIGKNMLLSVAELKETLVGKTENTRVGEFKNIMVGEQLTITVGASKFIMKEDGTVLITGKNFNFTASESVQINGKVVDLN